MNLPRDAESFWNVLILIILISLSKWISYTIESKFQLNLNRNSYIFNQENAFQNVCKMAATCIDLNVLTECLSRVNTSSFSVAYSVLCYALMPQLTRFDTSAFIDTRSSVEFIDSSSAVLDCFVPWTKYHFKSLILQVNIKKTYSISHSSLCLLMELGNLHALWWPLPAPV